MKNYIIEKKIYGNKRWEISLIIEFFPKGFLISIYCKKLKILIIIILFYQAILKIKFIIIYINYYNFFKDFNFSNYLVNSFFL